MIKAIALLTLGMVILSYWATNTDRVDRLNGKPRSYYMKQCLGSIDHELICLTDEYDCTIHCSRFANRMCQLHNCKKEIF